MSISSIYQKPFYGLILVISLALFITALGGGIFGQTTPWMLQWQHIAFVQLCHQQPRRSFWIAGQPMAVCARCFGIYSGFFALWLLLPLVSKIKKRGRFDTQFLLVVFLLNVIDVAGNMLGFWRNTLNSRFWAGSLLGIASALCISTLLVEQFHITLKKETNYGRSRAIRHSG